MPHHPQLLADVSKRLESRFGDSGDQEESCFQWLSVASGRCFSDEWRRDEGEKGPALTHGVCLYILRLIEIT